MMEEPRPAPYEASDKRKEALFDDLWERGVKNDFIEYDVPFPKHEFLKYLVSQKGVVLHGSNWVGVDDLQPQQANCRSKKFGNLNAVYATRDEVLPLFYAIKDRTKFRGMARSGASSGPGMEKTYHFAVGADMLALRPWSDGAVYILPQEAFEQGVDDNGMLIDEFVSRAPVTPIARLKVGPEDFPYLDSVGAIE